MDKKDQRINVTLFSTQEYEMVQTLAEIHGTSHSLVVAKGFSEWLKLNFTKEMKNYYKLQNLITKRKKTPPSTLKDSDLIYDMHENIEDIIGKYEKTRTN